METEAGAWRGDEFGRYAERNRRNRGDGKPGTFNFLGFTHSCAKTRKGWFTVLRQTMRQRWQAKLRELKTELRQRLHTPTAEQGGILALGRIGPRPLLRRTHEWPGLACLPPGCRSPVVDGVAPSQPRKPSALEPNDATGHPVASDSSYLPSLSPRATGRTYPRREPDAVMPHVRICGGGHARSLIPTPTLM